MSICSRTGQKTAGVQNLRVLLELLFQDSQRNVHAGELEVRPPAAPTTEAKERVAAVWSWPPSNRANDSSAMAHGPSGLNTSRGRRDGWRFRAESRIVHAGSNPGARNHLDLELVGAAA